MIIGIVVVIGSAVSDISNEINNIPTVSSSKLQSPSVPRLRLDLFTLFAMLIHQLKKNINKNFIVPILLTGRFIFSFLVYFIAECFNVQFTNCLVVAKFKSLMISHF